MEAFVVGMMQSQLLKSQAYRQLMRKSTMKIAIIGKGNVGNALNKGLSGKHETRFGHRDPAEPVAEAARWGEVIILAVPYENLANAIKEVKPFVDGKVVIDVTNAVNEKLELSIDCTSFSAEQTQKKLPKAHVVKAFNTVFAANQSVGKIGKDQLTAFIAGDDLGAKQVVASLTRDIGFDPVDCGPLKSSRYLDGMAMMLMQMAFLQGKGTKIGYKLAKGDV
jgi:predicted dinucleotide-binding enzyme